MINKLMCWVTIALIYIVMKIEELWKKLNKKALLYTVLSWTIFYILVKYFEYIVPLLVVVGVPLFALILTYKLFSFITEDKRPGYDDRNLFSLILTTLIKN